MMTMNHDKKAPFVRALLAGGLLLAGGAALAQKLEVAQYAEVYQGPKTLSVEVAPLKSGEQALVRFVGVNHEWNNKVFLADLKKVFNPYRVEYQATINGERQTLLWTDGERSPQTAAFLKPNQGNPMSNPSQALPVGFDKEAALKLPTAALLQAWERQSK
jgi:hypothetical protein